MQAVIKKWGNSPALRLNTSIMKSAQLELNQEVSIQVARGRIVLEPVSNREYNLNELISGITPENSHGEINYGATVGNEVW